MAPHADLDVRPPFADEDLSFPGIPPFPSDIPTAPLLRISLEKLLQDDPKENERFWQACYDLGFFYLDLRGAEGRNEGVPDEEGGRIDGDELLTAAQDVFDMAKEVFDLPHEEKLKYDMTTLKGFWGYKGFGNVGGKGENNQNEFWNVCKDDILGLMPPMSNPPGFSAEDRRAKFRRYILLSNAITRNVLTRLNDRLGLPKQTLNNLHKLSKPSGDHVRMFRAPPQKAMTEKAASLGAHTDFGSVTVLFNRMGGLQVLPPGATEWSYVKPLRGHCVVNLGDAMVKFSAGVLNSNIHRVVNPPGAQANETRYSLVYFSRPEDDVILKALAGSKMIDEKKREYDWPEEERDVTSKEWITKRALTRRINGDKIDANISRGERLKALVADC